MGALSDYTGFIISGDVKRNDLALNGSNLSLCPDFQTHGSGRDVLDVQHGTHGGLGIGQGIGNGFTGRALHQSNHAGGGIDQQIAGANFLCGVLTLSQGNDLCLHTNGDFHREPHPFNTF